MRVPPGLLSSNRMKFSNDVQYLFLGQHAIQQNLGLQAAFLFFVIPLPLDKVFPFAGDGAVTGPVAVADNQKGIVVKSMGYDIRVKIPGKVVVKARADIFINRFEFDEDQRESVDKANQIGPDVIMGYPRSLNL